MQVARCTTVRPIARNAPVGRFQLPYPLLYTLSSARPEMGHRTYGTECWQVTAITEWRRPTRGYVSAKSNGNCRRSDVVSE